MTLFNSSGNVCLLGITSTGARFSPCSVATDPLRSDLLVYRPGSGDTGNNEGLLQVFNAASLRSSWGS